MGALVWSLLGVNPNMSDEVARFLELSVAEGAGVEPDPLLQPGPDQVFPHLPILQPVSEHHLAKLGDSFTLAESSRCASDCRLDCAGEKIAVLLPSCLHSTRNMVIADFLRLITKFTLTDIKAFWLTVRVKA